MKKLILILVAVLFIDVGMFAQSRSSRSSGRSSRTEESSKKEKPAVQRSSRSSSSSERVTPGRSSSQQKKSEVRSSSRSSSGTVRPSSSRSQERNVNNNSRSSSRSSSAIRQKQGSSSSSNSRYRSGDNRSSNSRAIQNNNRGSSTNPSGRTSTGVSSRERNPSVGNVNRSSSRSGRENGRVEIRNNDTDTRTRYRESRGRDNSNSRIQSSSSDRRVRASRNSGGSTSVSRVERNAANDNRRTSVRRIERQTASHGTVIETRGTTYRKHYEVVRVERPVVRHVVRPRPIEYRRIHYIYRAPARVNFFWNVNIFNDFRVFYPRVVHWHYRRGARIETVSAYDAMFFVGEVKRVYGEVQEVFYSREDDAYYLYIGAPFPYHDFSVVIPGTDYRRHNFPRLDRLQFNHVWVMGLITEYDQRPEILIRRPYQLGIY